MGVDGFLMMLRVVVSMLVRRGLVLFLISYGFNHFYWCVNWGCLVEWGCCVIENVFFWGANQGNLTFYRKF